MQSNKTPLSSLNSLSSWFSSFVVVDTEGRDLLKEIAVIDHHGQVLYEAWVAEHPENQLRRSQVQSQVQPLTQVVQHFLSIVCHKTIVCHNASHDRKVIQRACQKAKIRMPSLKFICTVELSQVAFPSFASYALEYLSKKLTLRVADQFFNARQAHTAKYDAEFTYQLYRTILAMQHHPDSSNPVSTIETAAIDAVLPSPANPFSSSRVDTPFQDHPDQKKIYQQEFEQLKIAIAEIHQDTNRQSRGAVVIGEPGSGKTHLMMRLAQELLKVNRLLFIRSPNNSDTILYHIYSRILESVIQPVPGTGYSQLEYLLSHSFSKLIRTSTYLKLVNADQLILNAVQESPLNLYKLAAEGTDRKRAIWGHIDKRLQEWWVDTYGFSGSATQILKGIVKFCSYSNPIQKNIVQRWLAGSPLDEKDLAKVDLEDWRENLGLEEFSLEAIAVLSKLSLLDEPLLIVFDQLESLGLPHNEKILLNFGEAVKEIFTHVPNSLIILNLFPDRWEQFQNILSPAVVDRVSQVQVQLKLPSQDTLREILQLRLQSIDTDIHQIFSTEDLQVILTQKSIRAMLNCAAHYFRFRVNGISLPESLTSPKSWVGAKKSDINVPMQQVSTVQTTEHVVGNSAKNPVGNSAGFGDISEARFQRLEQRLEQLENRLGNFLQQSKQLIQPPILQPEIPQPIESIPTPVLQSPQSLQSSQSFQSPLWDYLQTQRQSLAKTYRTPQIITDSDDIGKLTTIAQAFQLIDPIEIDYLRLGKRVLPEHLILIGQKSMAIGFLQVDGNAFTHRIKNWNETVVTDRSMHYQLWRDCRQPEITGKVGREEIEKLNYCNHGQFMTLGEEERLDFELIYQLIIDIQNRDLDLTLEDALRQITIDLKESWLIQLIQSLK